MREVCFVGWRGGEGGSGVCSGGSSFLTGVVWDANTSSCTGSLLGSGFVLNSDSALNSGPVFDDGSILTDCSVVNGNCVFGSDTGLNSIVFAGDNFLHGGLLLNCGSV